jgi:hypothetical protein
MTITNVATIARLLFGAVLAAGSIMHSPAVVAEDKIVLCHAGLVELPRFAQHIANLRKKKRYSDDDLEQLIARNRKGGPAFFSSQIIVQASRRTMRAI